MLSQTQNRILTLYGLPPSKNLITYSAPSQPQKCPIIRSIPIPLSKACKHVVFAAHVFGHAK